MAMDAVSVTTTVSTNQPRIFANRDLIVYPSWGGVFLAVFGGSAELVADAANGFDQRAIGFQFPPKMADVHVDGPVKGRGLAIVHRFHQGIARNHGAGRAHQRFENIEFKGGHLNGALIAENFARAGVDQNAVDFDAPFGADLDPARDGADTSQKLAGVE